MASCCACGGGRSASAFTWAHCATAFAGSSFALTCGALCIPWVIMTSADNGNTLSFYAFLYGILECGESSFGPTCVSLVLDTAAGGVAGALAVNFQTGSRAAIGLGAAAFLLSLTALILTATAFRSLPGGALLCCPCKCCPAPWSATAEERQRRAATNVRVASCLQVAVFFALGIAADVFNSRLQAALLIVGLASPRIAVPGVGIAAFAALLAAAAAAFGAAFLCYIALDGGALFKGGADVHGAPAVVTLNVLQMQASSPAAYGYVFPPSPVMGGGVFAAATGVYTATAPPHGYPPVPAAPPQDPGYL